VLEIFNLYFVFLTFIKGQDLPFTVMILPKYSGSHVLNYEMSDGSW